MAQDKGSLGQNGISHHTLVLGLKEQTPLDNEPFSHYDQATSDGKLMHP